MQNIEPINSSSRVAALASGGLDSSVMLVGLAGSWEEVFPVYIRCGLHWEAPELDVLTAFLRKLGHPSIRNLHILDLPMSDVYQGLWYESGEGIPGYQEPDERWEIPGRNLILLTKTAVWCQINSVGAIALGSLGTNPFGDASPSFFDLFETLVRQGLGCSLRVLRPLGHLTKAEVIRAGAGLPLELTLTCASPRGMVHCGRCGKCRERVEAFREAGVPDPTRYQHRPGSGENS